MESQASKSQQSSFPAQPINVQLEDLYQVIEDDLSRVKLLNKGFSNEILALREETSLLVKFICENSKTK